ncbi:MAG: ComEC family competence protein, partial [Muribaculaceae bacterium]|nr:ComEC family competence protein [Muribaculaceae bacterium]
MRLTSPPLSYIPLLPILSGVVAGVLFGRYVSTDFSLWAGLMAMAGIGAVAMRRSVVAEVLLSMALGCVAVSMSVPREFTALPDRKCVMEGVVTEVSLNGDRQSAEVSVDDRYGDFKARITYPVFIPRLEVGDRIRFSGTYSLPRRPTDLPLEDDMAEYYFREGISLLCYVPQNCFEVTGRSGNPVLSLRRMRSGIVDRIYSSGLNEPTAIFLVAVLTGDTSALTPALRENYSAAGVAHILALSGAHVAIIAVAVSVLFFPLIFIGRRKLRWWLTIAVLWGYAVFTGMSPAVCRAVIMASAVLLALIFDRPRSSLNALCLAALLILLFSPMSLFNAGFQLSFAATLCIILFTPRFMPQSARKTYRYRAWGVVAVTLAATLGTVPLVAWHFHSIPLFFLPANIVAVALMPVMVAGGLLLTVLLSLGVAAGWLIGTLDFVYGIFD